jgi:hypothetical protein
MHQRYHGATHAARQRDDQVEARMMLLTAPSNRQSIRTAQ